MSVRFEEETAVSPLGGGRYAASFSRDWFVFAGPNGGVVAAVVLRACMAEIADGSRPPRTLTVHYLAPPAEGPAEVQVTVERAGRGISFVSARLTQAGAAKATALAAFGPARGEGMRWDARPRPELPPPGECPELDEASGENGPPAIRDRWECRWGLGDNGPLDADRGTLTGGWLRARDAAVVDHVLVAAMADAWAPPMIVRRGDHVFGVPTVELTVHFRDSADLATLDPKGWFACTFHTDVVQEGFAEEDGCIWSADGRLVAMSRQLAAVVDRREVHR
jgi:acyl-CoA thioesterase